MKYIRTKETEYGCIIDTIKYKEQTGEECYIPKNEIIKQADTIEELIDECVYEYSFENKKWWKVSVGPVDEAKDFIKKTLGRCSLWCNLD